MIDSSFCGLVPSPRDLHNVEHVNIYTAELPACICLAPPACKQVSVRMCLISARARVHVLVVMSRTKSVSITTDGPQEMFGPHADPLVLSLFLIFYLCDSLRQWDVHVRTSVGVLLVQIRWLPVEGFWEQAWWGWRGHKLSQCCAYLAPCFQLWLFESTWFTRHLFVLPLLVSFFSGSPLCVRIMQVLLLYKHKLPLFYGVVCVCALECPETRIQCSCLLSSIHLQ